MRSLILVLSLLGPAVFAAPNLVERAPNPPTKGRRVNYTDAFSGQFGVKTSSFQWIDAADDGTYVVQDGASLLFKNIVNNESTVFVDASQIIDGEGAVIDYHDFDIQPNQKHVLFSANYTKQYRHSFFANYYVFDVEAKTTIPLIKEQAGDIQWAGWSTVGNTIGFVRGNNLFAWQNGTATQITSDGGPDVFNAVPDWVYEEEIFGSHYTAWFSPDGEYLAFLRYNETGVPTFTIPYYMGGKTVAPLYPKELALRYPKVGETNPTISLHLVSLQNVTAAPVQVLVESYESADLLITEVAWVTDGHSHVIARSMNRVQDSEKLVLFETGTGKTSVVRERDGTDGWLESNMAIQYVGLDTPSYVDISDESGWQHIYLYEREGSVGKALTSGDWEVSSIVKIDTERDLVYFLSTEQNSTERHLYSVGLDGTGKKALVSEKEGYYSASFSAGGAYYLLTYSGPTLPWQKLYTINDTTTELQVINNNSALATKLSAFELPTSSWWTIPHPDGYSFNVIERLPAGFDPKKKYPVIFDPYGGPASQRTQKTFSGVNYRTYLGSDPELEYIVLVVDNRGTGFKGREFRSIVSKQLGKFEALDQVFAAQWYAKNKQYVDENHIAIWGWSYGGYLSAKVVELDTGVFTFAAITAPVSDWALYDSLYTERYMKTLKTNGAGYNETAVRKVDGFKNIAGGFLLQHGSGDDNVHWQHSAVLVDGLMAGGVSPEKMRATTYIDSDHSIRLHGSSAFLYKELTDALYGEKIRGKPDKPHQWDKKHVQVV